MSAAASDTLPAEEGLRTPWRPAEWAALLSGWILALAVLLPAALMPGAGPDRLALGAALAFWPLAVWIARSDLLHYVIPDEASAAIAFLGLVDAGGGAWLSGDGDGGAMRAALEGAGTGAGAFALFWAVGAGFRRFGRDALGFGDVKLAGACGIWLSPGDAALALEVAALGAVALLLLRHGDGRLRDAAAPFGAFLAPAAWLVFLLAPPLRDAGVLPW